MESSEVVRTHNLVPDVVCEVRIRLEVTGSRKPDCCDVKGQGNKLIQKQIHETRCDETVPFQRMSDVKRGSVDDLEDFLSTLLFRNEILA